MKKNKLRGKKDKMNLKQVRKMIRKEVKAQLSGLRDCLSGEFQVSIGEEMQRRTMAPFTGIAMHDAKAGEPVTIQLDNTEARY